MATLTRLLFKQGDIVHPHGTAPQIGEVHAWDEYRSQYVVAWHAETGDRLAYEYEQDLRRAKVETTVWEPDPERPGQGYYRLVRTKTVGEVFDEIVALVGREGYGHNEYFSLGGPLASSDEWPEGTIACFSVNGSSEGDYVHVEVHDGERRHLVLLAKTFDGRDASWHFARKLADILEELV